MAKKVIYFDKLCGFSVTAVTENGKLTDCRFTAEDGAPAIGNIYKGTVVNVLEGMQAAFLDCGLERNCYLSAEDLPYGTENGISSLKAGDVMMVQIIKTPCGKKGAKVSARISFVGKTLIYLPNSEFVGISHRIEDDELRESLMLAARKAVKKGEGLVIRNSAPFSSYKQIQDELDFLRAVYQKADAVYKKAEAGTLICTDFTMPVRVMREFTEYDVSSIVTGCKEQYEQIKELIKMIPGGKKIKLELYKGKRDMLDDLGVAAQIKEACSPRVSLGNGAYLIIERTEALTSIDVNTGGFIGDDSLEYTVYQTNILAAREIARQVKLRNIGGLFVVDFIDMRQPEHRQAIAEELEKSLKSDNAPYRVLPMSEFGLIEFTRKRSGEELASVGIKTCPVCGAGTDFSDEFYMLTAYSEVLKTLNGGAQTACVKVRPEVAAIISDRREFADSVREKFPDARVYLIPELEKHTGECICHAEGKDFVPPNEAIKVL